MSSGLANMAPTARTVKATVEEGGTLAGTLSATDPNGDPLTFTLLASGPAVPGLTLAADGSFTFTPDASFETLAEGQTRTVSLRYTASDGDATSLPATANITVLGRNDAPIAHGDILTRLAPVKGALAISAASLLKNDSDIDRGDIIKVVALSNDAVPGTTITTERGATVTLKGGTLFYTPAAELSPGERIQDSFDYVVQDKAGERDTATVTLTLCGPNKAPVAAGAKFAVNEDLPFVGNLSFADPDSTDPITFALVTPIKGLTLAPDFAASGAFSYDARTAGYDSLAAGQTARVSFRFTVNDGLATSAPGTVALTITGKNDGPLAADDRLIVAPASGKPVSISVATLLKNDSDPDRGDVLRLTLGEPDSGISIGTALGATVTLAGNKLLYTPAPESAELIAGERVQDSFTYTVQDKAGATDTATVTLTLAGPNTAPKATSKGFGVTEDSPFEGHLSFTDPNAADPISFALKTPIKGLMLAEDFATSGAFTFNAHAAGFDSLRAGQTANVSFLFTVNDGLATSAPGKVVLTITGENDAPTATHDTLTYAGKAGGPVMIAAATLLANDTDPDRGDTKAIVSVDSGDGAVMASTALGGTVSLNPATGAITYRPGAAFLALVEGEQATDSFAYTMRDKSGATSTATVSIRLKGVNDAPSGEDATIAFNQAGHVFAMEDFGFSDPDQGDGLRAIRVTTLPSVGTLKLDGKALGKGATILASDIADGKLVLVPPAGADRTGSLTFQVQDRHKLFDATPNKLTLVFDNTSPDTTIADHPDLLTRETSASFAFGATETGVRYEISLDDAAFEALGAGETTTSFADLADGSHTLRVRAIDQAGNTDDTPAEFIWDVRSDLPDPPTIAVTADGGAPADLTRDNTLHVSGTAAPGIEVTVTWVQAGGATGTLSATADANGNWQVDTAELADGSYSFTATATSPGGAESLTSSAVDVMIDTVTSAPQISSSAEPTNDNTPTVGGLAEPGSTVTLYEGIQPLGSVVANQAGAWSITLPSLPDGTHTLSAKAVDQAGNQSAVTTISFTVDTVAPSAPIVTGGGGSTTDVTPQISGTAEAGSTVELFENGVLKGSTVANGAGVWSVTLNPLAVGAHTFTAKARDAAGNVSAASTVTTIIQTDQTGGQPMALDMFLRLKGVTGESLDKSHAGDVDVLAWSWGASNSGTTQAGTGSGVGKASFQDLSLTKWLDKASPTLLLDLAQGKHIASGDLFVRKSGETQVEIIKFHFEDILVKSYSMGGSGGEDRLTENIALNFAKFSFTYTPLNANGSAGAQITVGWDIAANTTFNGPTATALFASALAAAASGSEFDFTPTLTAGADTIQDKKGAMKIAASSLLHNDIDDNHSGKLKIIGIGADGKATGQTDLGGTIALKGQNIFYDPGAAFAHLKAGETAADTFTYTVRSKVGEFTTGTVSVILTGVNDAPTLARQTFAGDEDQVISGQIEGHDVDGDALTYRLLHPVKGLTLHEDGTFDFDPHQAGLDSQAAGQTRTVSFQVRATDGSLKSHIVEDKIIITGVNDAPVATDDVAAYTGSRGAAQVIGAGRLLANDKDVDRGDVLKIAAVDGSALQYGSVSLTAKGQVVYDPHSSVYRIGTGETIADTFTYDVRDKAGATDTATVSVKLSGQKVSATDTLTLRETSDLVVVDLEHLTNVTLKTDGSVRTMATVAGFNPDADSFAFTGSSLGKNFDQSNYTDLTLTEALKKAADLLMQDRLDNGTTVNATEILLNGADYLYVDHNRDGVLNAKDGLIKLAGSFSETILF